MTKPRLPNWPARMTAPYAAAYFGVGETKWLDGVKAGRYPKPTYDGGNVLWHKATLDEWLEQERGPGGGAAIDPYEVGLDRCG